MSRPIGTFKTPAYCHHKASGRAYVTVGSKPTYLGRYGSKESRDAYDRVIGEWLVNGRAVVTSPDEASFASKTVTSLIAQFWAHAETYYVSDPVAAGKRPTGELGNFWDVLKVLQRTYGLTPAAEFGPRSLKAVREEMIRLCWCRNTVNRQISRIKAVFKWAVANELTPPSVHHGLLAVEGLRRGRGGVAESKPVKPVNVEHFNATLPFLSRHLRAMVELQLLTGMRPGEVRAIRGCEIDRRGEVWIYKPSQHKTAHHGHARIIHIGPKAIALLQPFLKTNPDEFLFSPAEAVAEMVATRRSARATPLSCGNRIGTNRRRTPQRHPGKMYSSQSYARAISRACDAANQQAKSGRIGGEEERIISHWHPHQLRHNAATLLRKLYGIDAARAVLGHRTGAMTEVYAELDGAKAEQVMREVG